MPPQADQGIDLFISYSRRNLEFVEKLAKAVIERDKTPWFDKQKEALVGLPPGSFWWDEIKEGITTADNFVFVISTTSVISPYCQAELDWALKHDKRIFPLPICALEDAESSIAKIPDDAIVPDAVDARDRNLKRLATNNWDKLSDRQCIEGFFDPEKKKEASEEDPESPKEEKKLPILALQELIDALDRDVEHTRKHTRLLQRTTEWEKSERRKDFLLQGGDLRNAITWLEAWDMDAPDDKKKPVPTNPQREYIRDSRIAQARRQRTQLSASAIALVIVTALAVLSMFLFQQSETRLDESNLRGTHVAYQAATATVAQGEALINAAQSESLRLDTVSTDLIQDDGDPELAALLAILALRTAPLHEAKLTMLEALDHLYTVQSYHMPNWANGIVAFSPDGSRILLTGGFDDQCRVFLLDAESGKVLQVFRGHTQVANAVAFSPDGRTIATGAWDNTARLWDVATGSQLYLLDVHTANVNSVNFSPDGSILLTGSLDGTARFWDVSSGEQVRQIDSFQAGNPAALDPIHAAVFSPDGTHVLIASNNLAAQLYDVESGTVVKEYIGHTHYIEAAAFSPDGTLLLTGSQDNTARLWDVATGMELHRLAGHTQLVRSVAFSPDGRYALTGSWDGTAILWSTATGEPLRKLQGHPEKFTGSPEMFNRLTAAMVLSVAYAPQGDYVLTGSVEDARLWDVRLDASQRKLENHNGAALSLAYSPDGQTIATGSADGGVRLWDAQTEVLIERFDYETVDAGGAVDVVSLAFAPDSSQLAVSSWNKNHAVRIRDLATSTDVGILTGHSDWVTSVAYSPDGQYLVTGSHDRTARLWDAQSYTLLHTFSRHTNWVTSVAVAPDNMHVLTGSTDRTARLWDVETGELLLVIEVPEMVNSVSFSPDSRYVLLGLASNAAQVHDRQTGELVATLADHTDWIASAVYSPDGRYILTGSFDHTADLWDAASYTLVESFEGHTASITQAVFSPDSELVVTASLDQTVRLWNAKSAGLLEYACSRVFRDFSDVDYSRYHLQAETTACP